MLAEKFSLWSGALFKSNSVPQDTSGDESGRSWSRNRVTGEFGCMALFWVAYWTSASPNYEVNTFVYMKFVHILCPTAAAFSAPSLVRFELYILWEKSWSNSCRLRSHYSPSFHHRQSPMLQIIIPLSNLALQRHIAIPANHCTLVQIQVLFQEKDGKIEIVLQQKLWT